MNENTPQATPAKARALRPRDAATLIIIDDTSGEPRVLLGRRRPDMVFMPGRYVFPGGRVDRADRLIDAGSDLRRDDLLKLMVAMKGAPSEARARALGLAAIRETFEEAGLVIGAPTSTGGPAKAPGWRDFFATGFRPALDRLTFFARAITPPGRPRRFDTRFFCVPADAIAHKITVQDGELSDLEWHSIGQARGLELPNITRVILEDLGERIAARTLHAGQAPVPFYHRRNGSFRRDLISADTILD
ncbi:MAG TPA: NUDIX hydrolase [Hyphomicrobiaceae bacterium]|jgi:8-oxo-dGTP pyrophosphatase MutT (NUDIX family)|nr:NUDIX hydrolase [Hyphomicrobiaceae bacterium]